MRPADVNEGGANAAPPPQSCCARLMAWTAVVHAWQLKISNLIGKGVAWGVIVIAGVLLYEVCARYLFSRPTDWAHELSTFIYGGFCVLSGLYAQAHNKHVRVDIIYQIMPPRLRKSCDCLIGVIVITTMGFLCYSTGLFAYDSWISQETSSKSTWAPHLYPLKATLALALVLMLLNQILFLWRDILLLMTGQFSVQTPEIEELTETLNPDDDHGGVHYV